MLPSSMRKDASAPHDDTMKKLSWLYHPHEFDVLIQRSPKVYSKRRSHHHHHHHATTSSRISSSSSSRHRRNHGGAIPSQRMQRKVTMRVWCDTLRLELVQLAEMVGRTSKQLQFCPPSRAAAASE